MSQYEAKIFGGIGHEAIGEAIEIHGIMCKIVDVEVISDNESNLTVEPLESNDALDEIASEFNQEMVKH